MLIFRYWSRWTYAVSARARLVLNSWRSPCCSSKGCVSVRIWSRWTYAASARAHLVLNSWRSPCCSSKGCVSARYSIIDFNGTWAVSSRAQLILNIDHDGTYAASARARLVLNSWQSPCCSSRGCVNVRYATTNLIIWTEPTLFQQGLS